MATGSISQHTELSITTDTQTTFSSSSPSHADKEPTFQATVPLSTTRDRREAILKQKWTSCLGNNQKDSPLHKHVAVLLMSWNKSSDDLHVEEEINGLAEVFKNSYHYEVVRAELDTNAKLRPQLQANGAMIDFVKKYDADDTLLIVYYGGHGRPGRLYGELKMMGVASSDRNVVNWNNVEANLRDAEADVLEILDCCYASEIVRARRSYGERAFEFIASTTSETARAPGPSSFTSALIWALKELAVPDPEERECMGPGEVRKICTTDLSEMITIHKKFPNDQTPYPGRRASGSADPIVFAPLPAPDKAAPQRVRPSHKPDPEYLDVRFCFRSQVKEWEVHALARTLLLFMKKEKVHLDHVSWEGLKPGDGKSYSLWNKAVTLAGRQARSHGSSAADRKLKKALSHLQVPSAREELDGNASDASTVVEVEPAYKRSPHGVVPTPAQKHEMVQSILALFTVVVGLWAAVRSLLATEREFRLHLGVACVHVTLRGRTAASVKG